MLRPSTQFLQVPAGLSRSTPVCIAPLACCTGGLLGDVVVRPGFAPLPLPSPPALAMSLAELAALHRDAVLRVVRELALGFGR
jgi:hypothetical protein